MQSAEITSYKPLAGTDPLDAHLDYSGSPTIRELGLVTLHKRLSR